MFREADRVVLKKAKPEYGLNRGAVGIIVKAHKGSAGYEVEFMAPVGKPAIVVLLKTGDIRAAD